MKEAVIAQTRTDLPVRVVFSTKERMALLNNALKTRLPAYLGGGRTLVGKQVTTSTLALQIFIDREEGLL